MSQRRDFVGSPTVQMAKVIRRMGNTMTADKETIEHLRKMLADKNGELACMTVDLGKLRGRIVVLEDELRKKESAPKWVAPISQALADGGEKAKKGAK